MRKILISAVAAGTLLAAGGFTLAAHAVGPEGCVVQNGSNGAAVGNPVLGPTPSGSSSSSAPGTTCSYAATQSGGWAGNGAVTIQYGPGTLGTGTNPTCTFTSSTTFANASGPFSSASPSAAPGTIGPIVNGDCVTVTAG